MHAVMSIGKHSIAPSAHLQLTFFNMASPVRCSVVSVFMLNECWVSVSDSMGHLGFKRKLNAEFGSYC